MLCGWLSSSVARLVVNTVPPTFSSTRSGKQLVTGGGAAWRPLVEGCCWGRGSAAAAAAAVPTQGTLWGGAAASAPACVLPTCCCWGLSTPRMHDCSYTHTNTHSSSLWQQ